MDWDSVTAVIPTVLSIPERAESLHQLLLQLGQQCPGLWVRLLPQYERPPDIARHACAVIGAGLRDITRPWVLFVEDDAELAEDFGARALEALQQEPADAVSFFSPWAEDLNRLRRGERYYPAPRPFVYSQCVALRSELADAWGVCLPTWPDRSPDQRAAIDHALGYCCDELGASLVIHVPSLVQHRQVPSAFGHSSSPRSPSFGKS